MNYSTARQVRKRYGDVSDMTLWRWLHNENLGFPQPRVINRRRYFAVEDLDAFDQQRAASPPAAGGMSGAPEGSIA